MSAPPSIALAMMAAALAQERGGSCVVGWGNHWLGLHRCELRTVKDCLDYPASTEYYRIIDRISRGEQP